jgi:hypothetical protein
VQEDFSGISAAPASPEKANPLESFIWLRLAIAEQTFQDGSIQNAGALFNPR